MPDEPNQIEQLILLSLVRLGDEAYGVPIRSEIETRSGRSVSLAAVYGALERLEVRGRVRAWYSEPLPERGALRARAELRQGERAIVRAPHALPASRWFSFWNAHN